MRENHRTGYYRLIVWAAAAVAGCAVAVAAVDTQPASAPTTSEAALSRDVRLSLLKTKEAELEIHKAKAAVERAEVELKDTQYLYDQRVKTANELYEKQQAYKQAMIAYDQAVIKLGETRLEFLKNATLIRVVGAKKYREEGEYMASIELLNDSDINKARVIMTEGESEAAMSESNLASLLKVPNIIVTLRAAAPLPAVGEEQTRYEKAIVGDPFQRVVPELALGHTAKLDFRLLKKDVEHVTVQVEYLETTKDYEVFLQTEALEDVPTITSAQFDQQGDLGTVIRYNLRLDRLAQTDQEFSLRVLNFPEGIPFSFIDPDSKTEAKLTTLKFTSEQPTRNVDFEVRIPEKLPDPKLIDTNVPFYIVVARPTEMEKLHDLKKQYPDKPIPAEEIAKIKGNVIELILIPKGVGELELIVSNLYKEVQQGEDVVLKFSVMNPGTLAVGRVTPKMDLPLEWEGEITPQDVQVIDPAQKVLFTANVRPPPDVAVGQYVIKMEAEGHAGVTTIEAKERDFTVAVVAKSHLTGTAILVAILVVLVLGIAVASVKIARR